MPGAAHSSASFVLFVGTHFTQMALGGCFVYCCPPCTTARAKAGSAIHGDYKELVDNYSIKPQGFVDTQVVAASVGLGTLKAPMGLARMAGFINGLHVSKQKHVSCSNWEQPLDAHQVCGVGITSALALATVCCGTNTCRSGRPCARASSNYSVSVWLFCSAVVP